MQWHVSHRFDARALPLVNRHYPRQNQSAPQFVRPGSCVVLLTVDADAVWVTSRQKYVDHYWPGAWECTSFRNESPHLSSSLIREAMAVTVFEWGEPPPQGMITMVDIDKVRHKRDPGRCYVKAGFAPIACVFNRRGRKLVLRIDPQDMPRAEPAIGAALRLAI